MIQQQLEIYTKKKELSQKAKEEILRILAEADIDRIGEVEELVITLMQLNIDVTYNYIKTRFPCLAEAKQADYLVAFKKALSANKIVYLYVVCAALQVVDKSELSTRLLEDCISTLMFDKKTNKQLYIGIERVLKYDGSSILFAKFEGWTKRDINGYASFLVRFFEYIKKEEYLPMIVSWFNFNGIAIPQSISTKIEDSSTKTNEPTKKLLTVEKPINDYTAEALLAALQNRLVADAEVLSRIISENDDLKSKISVLQIESEELKKHNFNLTKTGEHLAKNINDLKETLNKSQQEVIQLRTSCSQTKTENETLSQRLANVESAYNHAGTQEIDELKLKIKRRLETTYSKYLDIKSKEPDIDYYEILILALDDVFKTLKKIGIAF